MVKPRKNIIGTKHGRLKIEKQVEDYISPKGIHYARYKCVCECGNIRYYTIANLRDKRIMSCGCINYEVVKDERKLKKRNKYDLSGEYGIGYTKEGEEFWFDKEDYEKIKDYNWNYDNNGYLSTIITEKGKKKKITLHRLVMGEIPKKMIVDHKIHPHGRKNKKDNRKKNLEIKTNSQNMMNVEYYKNNTSGYMGVTKSNRCSTWIARIQVDGKRKYLGSYKTKKEAIKARKEAEIKYFGEYANNRIKEKENGIRNDNL